jgi:UDP-N-acetylmuramyl pentapeptide phosphotransferase/UDP-N-acetylglucosamine-1-phosphate transferase
MDILLDSTLLLGMSFALAVFLTAIVRFIAKRFGWLDHPQEDRWHSIPTAQYGGAALFATAITVVFSLVELDAPILWVIMGGTVVFGGAIYDDLKGIKPWMKITTQTIAAICIIKAGLILGGPVVGLSLLILSIQILYIVGLLNVVNLIDGMDGLASGIVAISAFCTAGLSLIYGDTFGLQVSILVTGIALGFLIHNYPPARIFMGDCGSQLLGYLLAVATISVSMHLQPAPKLVRILAAGSLTAVPILDALFVSVLRLSVKQSLTRGGNHHMMHKLVLAGFSERKTILILYLVTAAFGAIALVVYVDYQLFLVFFGFAIFMFVMLELLLVQQAGFLPGRNGDAADQSNRMRLVSVLRRIDPFPKIVADIVIVASAIIIAQYLSGAVGIGESISMVTIGTAILIKLFIFAVFGIYNNSMFRYAGTPEFILVSMAIVTGSIVLGLTALIFSPLVSFGPRLVFIDAVLSLLGIVGIRTCFRVFRHVIASQSSTKYRVLVYGAGDRGIAAVRFLRFSKKKQMTPIGYIDDDPGKVGKVIYGLRVLGDKNSINDIHESVHFDELVISSNKICTACAEQISELCQQIGSKCSRLVIELEDVVGIGAPIPDDSQISVLVEELV